MAAASLTMFLGTTLMTTTIIGPKIMADNKLLSFTGMNYKSSVEYNILLIIPHTLFIKPIILTLNHETIKL
ncbi:hypothetical protein [Spiroplasma endosymbiont of Virgichneumon dumeticola]|uniref:hypothetical protein n=1 Tax=Spiroplasma endosymbiont of Virgichneumon dumeticola TaxID=3139323 RepID=UPI0035C8F4EC